MCASASQSTSPAGGQTSRRAIWLPIVPLGTNTAADTSKRSATAASSAATDGSSPSTSSPTSASAIARRIAAVERVTLSERRSTGTQHLRHEERELQRLRGVQPRVARGLVPHAQVRDLLVAAEALGHVVTGQLNVQPSGHRAQLAVHREERPDLRHDVVEV